MSLLDHPAQWSGKKTCTVVIINQDCWQGNRSGLSRSGDSHAWTHLSLNDENSTYWFSAGANNACNWFKCDPRHGGLSPESSAFVRNWPWLRLSSALELQDGWNLNCNVIGGGKKLFFSLSLSTQEPLIHTIRGKLSNLRCSLQVCLGKLHIFFKPCEQAVWEQGRTFWSNDGMSILIKSQVSTMLSRKSYPAEWKRGGWGVFITYTLVNIDEVAI